LPGNHVAGDRESESLGRVDPGDTHHEFSAPAAGFELALELTVKATLARRRVAEIPTTWKDRTAGQSNFKLRKWLPHYLHWYRVAFLRR
jgi:hypothetical protein